MRDQLHTPYTIHHTRYAITQSPHQPSPNLSHLNPTFSAVMRRLVPRLDSNLLLNTISRIDRSTRRGVPRIPRVGLFPSFGAVEESLDVA
jgi:hypothetical protein